MIEFENVSYLGLGTQRFPIHDGQLDRSMVKAIITSCMDQGINLFETSMVYNDGDTEKALGECLSTYDRNQYAICTKFNVALSNDLPTSFENQLKRLDTLYIDYYFYHCLSEDTYDAYCDQQWLDYLIQKKRDGLIGKLGFSTHAKVDTLKKYLDRCDQYFDIVMLQLNVVDWFRKDVKHQYKLVKDHGLSVWAMQPLRNKRIFEIDEGSKAALKARRPQWTLAQWAFAFVQSLDGVDHIISGMVEPLQIESNAQFFKSRHVLDPQDRELIESIGQATADQLV